MSPRAATAEPMHPRAGAPQPEKPPQCEDRSLQLESSPHSLQLEEARAQHQSPRAAKNNNNNKNHGFGARYMFQICNLQRKLLL